VGKAKRVIDHRKKRRSRRQSPGLMPVTTDQADHGSIYL
jgi:hypothetical protein